MWLHPGSALPRSAAGGDSNRLWVGNRIICIVVSKRSSEGGWWSRQHGRESIPSSGRAQSFSFTSQRSPRYLRPSAASPAAASCSGPGRVGPGSGGAQGSPQVWDFFFLMR